MVADKGNQADAGLNQQQIDDLIRAYRVTITHPRLKTVTFDVRGSRHEIERALARVLGSPARFTVTAL